MQNDKALNTLKSVGKLVKNSRYGLRNNALTHHKIQQCVEIIDDINDNNNEYQPNRSSTKRNREYDDNLDNLIKDIDYDPHLSKGKIQQIIMGWTKFNTYVQASDIKHQININDMRDWVSGTGVKNYLLKDPILDWYNLYYNPRNSYYKAPNDTNSTNLINLENPSNFENSPHIFQTPQTDQSNIFFEMGYKFESTVMDHLYRLYPDYIVKASNGRVTDLSYINKTKELMLRGIPIIEQAPLYNFENKTFGVADLIVRSDWINRLFKNRIMDEREESLNAPLLNKNYHYVVIDIKWTTTYLCKEMNLIRNSNRFPSYKGQLAIYNAAVGLIQGYIPSKAYILSKAYALDEKTYIYNCFDRLGVIDYDNFDNQYIGRTFEAINWIREVRYNGMDWDIYNPQRSELYPNMCNKYDAPYHSAKKSLAGHLGELTDIWMIGVKNRSIAHENNIYSWRDSNCSIDKMGLGKYKVGPTIEKIIKINRDKTNLILPKKITNNIENWQSEHNLEFYIDFETVNMCFDNSPNMDLTQSKTDNQLIFLIGIVYKCDIGDVNDMGYVYKYFISNELSKKGEADILFKFVSFIEEFIINHTSTQSINKAKLFHWGNAEKSVMQMANARNNYRYNNFINNCAIWIDMCKIFTTEPIVIHGAKNFNLKEITNAMCKNSMITTKWDSNGPSDGLNAMFDAIHCYKAFNNNNNLVESIEDYQMMKNIINYNKSDCESVCEIVNYLRTFNTNYN